MNGASVPQSGKAGGQMAHNYTYDALYRLVSATGTYTGADNKTASYTLAMGYDNMHRITSKRQILTQNNVQFNGTLNAGYDLSYTYGTETGKKFQLANVKDVNYRTEETPSESENVNNNHAYEYDANGNLVYVNTSRTKKDGMADEKTAERKLKWDEENRLLASDDNGFVTNYWYDADGERTVKTSGESDQVYVNSEFAGGRTNTAKFSLYVSPYLVANQGGRYTKHIYIGSQRVVSKIGDFDSYGSDPRRIQYAGSETDGLSVDYKVKYTQQLQVIKDNYATFAVPYNGEDNNDYVDGKGFCCNDGSLEAAQARVMARAMKNNFQEGDTYEKMQFYYHPDHLGSSSYITNLEGEVVQHIEYVPFGEVFVEERNNIWNTPYLFNAKEFDEETGLYYYGARYYDPRINVWISTDPLQESDLGVSSYCFVKNNPIYYIDPTGQIPIAPIIWWAGKRVVAGAIVDIGVQLLQEWVKNGGSVGQAWNRLNINWVQVTSSAGENLIKNKYAAAALSAASDMTTYMLQNDNWTWDGAFKQAGYGALSSIVGNELAGIFARKFGDISITAKQIFSGSLENRKGTFMEGSNIPLTDWFIAAYLMTSSKNGINTTQLRVYLDVSKKTAWFMLQRIRQAFVQNPTEKFDGVVEVDETYVGGKNKNRHRNKKVKHSQGRSTKDKAPVFGILQRDGKVFVKVVKNVGWKVLTGNMLRKIKAGSTIYSDEYSAYQRVFGKAKAFTHKIVVHGKGNYVNGDVHTNNIEGFWNITKDAVCGTYNHVSRKYLQRYCDEVSFRFNNRKVSKGESFCDLFANCMGTRITYKQLVTS